MQKRLALFDFDGTMIKGDSIAALVRAQFFQDIISLKDLLIILWQTLCWKLGKLPVESVKTRSLAGLSAIPSAQAEQFLNEFATKALYPRIYRKAIKKLQAHKDKGHIVVLVSASPLCCLQYLQDLLPVDHIIATQTDEQYKVTCNVVKEEKCRQIQAWVDSHKLDVDWAGSYAYGDSANDLPMLGMVGMPRLVNAHAKARKLRPNTVLEQWKGKTINGAQ